MLKKVLILMISVGTLVSCEPDPENPTVHELDLDNKVVQEGMLNTNSSFTTYLPIYSSVYAISHNDVRSLTSTVSIHNMNLEDSLFVKKIDYFNTEGDLVRSYIDHPIFIKPMETVNIVVHQIDNLGGTGANFLIDWALNDKSANPPLIEAVMISTSGQQGISFTTRGEIMDYPDDSDLMKKEILDSI